MDHRQILELLPAYVDQELGISETVAVERHLGDCAECQQAYAEQSVLSARLKKEASYFLPPAGLAGRIQAALPRADSGAARPKWQGFKWFSAAAAVALLLAVVWNIGLYSSQPSARERLVEEVVASHVRSLQVDHLADVASSDRHTVKPWFNGKLDFSPPVVDLAPQGFALEGGRLDYLDGRPVAALIYRHDRHPINLYAWPSADKDAAIQLQTSQGYHLAHWAGNGMSYWAISDLAANELDQFAAALRAAAPQ
ncbi:MAG TPA: anti-sigma factor [Burkholderiaceae bacterium]|nr:anti-sigma factor [Burkholderiaceae bacterium]